MSKFSTQPRFKTLGLHPEFIGGGIASRKLRISPFTYNPYPETLKPSRKGPWERSVHDQMVLEKLRSINTNVLERERLKTEVKCPGDIDNLDGLKENRPNLNDLNFGTTKRFVNKFENLTPGPGSYGKHHIPDQLYQEKKGQFLTFSTIPEFERDGLIGRKTCPKTTLLPPNLYCPVEQNAVSIRLIKKKVSKRGPYDLFTGPREEANNKNKFGQTYIIKSYCKKIFYPKTSGLDKLLSHPDNINKGKFYKSPRFKTMVTVIDPLEEDQYLIHPSPNPTTYNPMLPRASYKDHVKKLPFNSSNMKVRPDTFDSTLPGPGRYVSNIKQKTKKSWPFVAKYPRSFLPVPKPYNNF